MRECEKSLMVTSEWQRLDRNGAVRHEVREKIQDY